MYYAKIEICSQIMKSLCGKVFIKGKFAGNVEQNTVKRCCKAVFVVMCKLTPEEKIKHWSYCVVYVIVAKGNRMISWK